MTSHPAYRAYDARTRKTEYKKREKGTKPNTDYLVLITKLCTKTTHLFTLVAIALFEF